MLAWAAMRRRVGLAVTLLIAGAAGASAARRRAQAPPTPRPPRRRRRGQRRLGAQSSRRRSPAAHLAGGDVIAAGLVVATHSITASRDRRGASGQAGWTHAGRPRRGVVGGRRAPCVADRVRERRSSGAARSGRRAGTSRSCSRRTGTSWTGRSTWARSSARPMTGSPGAKRRPTARLELRSGRTRRQATTGGSPSVHDDTGPALTEDFTLTCGAGEPTRSSKGTRRADARLRNRRRRRSDPLRDHRPTRSRTRRRARSFPRGRRGRPRAHARLEWRRGPGGRSSRGRRESPSRRQGAGRSRGRRGRGGRGRAPGRARDDSRRERRVPQWAGGASVHALRIARGERREVAARRRSK